MRLCIKRIDGQRGETASPLTVLRNKPGKEGRGGRFPQRLHNMSSEAIIETPSVRMIGQFASRGNSIEAAESSFSKNNSMS